MQPYMQRWPWWSPVRLLAGAMMLGLLVLGLIAARDALARGLQVYLAAFTIGTLLVTVVVAIGRPQLRFGPLLFGAAFCSLRGASSVCSCLG